MTLVRFLYVAGLLLSTGSAVTAARVLPRALAGVHDPAHAAATTTRAHRVVGAAGVLLLVATAATLLVDPGRLGPRWVEPATLALAVVTGATGTLLLTGRGRGPQTLLVLVCSTLATVLLPALPTTWSGLTLQSVLDPVASRAHILGGSLWVGGLVLTVLLLLRPGPAHRSGDLGFWPRWWTAFSGQATIALGIVVVTGSWLVWTRVGSLDNLLTTSYGVAVTVKVGIVAVMAGLGGLHQLRLIPGIARARAAGDEASVLRIAVRDFRGTVVVEALLGIAVIAVVPFLTGSAREQAAVAAGRPYRPAVLDLQVAAIGLAGVVVMVLMLWGATRVSGVAPRDRLTGPDAGGR